MMRRLLSVLFFLFSAAWAQAYTDMGGRLTAGPNSYTGMNIFAEWGNDDYYLRPAVNTYKSDLADRYSTYSLGGGLEEADWRAGAEIFLTPETGGYNNKGLYADFSYYLVSSPKEEAALQDASLGVFAGLTAHEDIYAASTATVSVGKHGSAGVTLTDAFRLSQTDYGLSAMVKLYGLRASGRFSKTAYDKDVTAEVRELPVDVGGIGTSGFPDSGVSARLRYSGLPLTPEAGYVRTTYLLGQPTSESFTLGLAFKTGNANISAGWENFNPGGGASKSDYYSLGLALSF